jgi:hypothetical protein
MEEILFEVVGIALRSVVRAEDIGDRVSFGKSG